VETDLELHLIAPDGSLSDPLSPAPAGVYQVVYRKAVATQQTLDSLWTLLCGMKTGGDSDSRRVKLADVQHCTEEARALVQRHRGWTVSNDNLLRPTALHMVTKIFANWRDDKVPRAYGETLLPIVNDLLEEDAAAQLAYSRPPPLGYVMEACKDVRLVRRLLELGLDANAPCTGRGELPLQYINLRRAPGFDKPMAGELAMAAALLEHGADPSLYHEQRDPSEQARTGADVVAAVRRDQQEGGTDWTDERYWDRIENTRHLEDDSE